MLAAMLRKPTMPKPKQNAGVLLLESNAKEKGEEKAADLATSSDKDPVGRRVPSQGAVQSSVICIAPGFQPS